MSSVEPAITETGDVFADFARWLEVKRARDERFWVGDPDPRAVDELAETWKNEWSTPFPASLQTFLLRWNGFEPQASSILWPAFGNDRDAVAAFDEPDCERAFTLGELRDSGYFFFLVDGSAEPPIYFFDYSEPPPIFRVADDFPSFLREWMRADLVTVIAHGRERLLGRPTGRPPSARIR